MFEHALAAIDSGTLDATVDFVFMHRERGEGDGSDAFMDLAASRRIPVHAVSSQRFRREHDGDLAGHREEFDRLILHAIAPYEPDVIVLAGYLLIVSPLLTSTHRLLNLHPALPDGPVGLWQQVIWQLIDQRATESGNTTFLVSNELDRGPRVSWCRFPLRGPAFDPLWNAIGDASVDELREAQGEEHPLFQAIRQAGVSREPHLLVETLAAVARGEAMAGPPGSWQGVDLTDRVEGTLQRT